MRVLATGSSVDLDVRPTSTLSGERLPVAGGVLSALGGAPPAPAVAVVSAALPVTGVVCADGGVPTGADCAGATAPLLADVCTAPFAVAAAALSAARLSLASSIVHAVASRASAAAAFLAALLTRGLISPSV
jgi:hypothetical protein